MKKIISGSALALLFFGIVGPASAAQCIITLSGKQYDVTTLQTSHSGGNVFVCGTDQSALFQGKHGTDLARMAKYLVEPAATASASTTASTTPPVPTLYHEDDRGKELERRGENEKRQLEKRREQDKKLAEIRKRQAEKRLEIEKRKIELRKKQAEMKQRVQRNKQARKAFDAQLEITALEAKIKYIEEELAKITAKINASSTVATSTLSTDQLARLQELKKKYAEKRAEVLKRRLELKKKQVENQALAKQNAEAKRALNVQTAISGLEAKIKLLEAELAKLATQK